MQKKSRKNINISLQTKKYLAPINDIVDKWEDEGESISVKVCDLIIFFDKFDNSFTLSNIKNIVELAEKMISRHMPINSSTESRRLLEDVLRECISIDNDKLSKALNGLDKSDSNLINMEQNLHQPKPQSQNLLDKNEKNIEDDIKVEIETKEDSNNEEVVFEYDIDDDKNKIPYNFLFNS